MNTSVTFSHGETDVTISLPVPADADAELYPGALQAITDSSLCKFARVLKIAAQDHPELMPILAGYFAEYMDELEAHLLAMGERIEHGEDAFSLVMGWLLCREDTEAPKSPFDDFVNDIDWNAQS